MLVKSLVSYIKKLFCRHDWMFEDNIPLNHQTKSKWCCCKCGSSNIKEKEHVVVMIHNLKGREKERYIFYSRQTAEIMISCCGFSRGVAKFAIYQALKKKEGSYRLRNHLGETCHVENMSHDKRFWKYPTAVLPFNIMPFGPRSKI